MAGSVQMDHSSTPIVPPRPIDARVRRRVWAEPTVRFWTMTFIVVLLIDAYVAFNNLQGWLHQRELILHGMQVQALVAEVDGVARVLRVPPETPVTLQFEMDGKPHEVQGILNGRKEYITTRQTVPIRVDPKDVTRWTYATEVPGLMREMAMTLLLLPAVVLLAIVVVLRRRALLRLWEQGAAVAAVVASSRSSALAPFSKLVQVALRDSEDKRLLSTYVVRHKVDLHQGSTLWLIVDNPANPRRIIHSDTFS